MRRSRRGGHSGLEFGGSGEDSFVAVVVTKLTGALLFILLLAMVIMALIPKGDPDRAGQDAAAAAPRPAARCGSRPPAPCPTPWRAGPTSSPWPPPAGMAHRDGTSRGSCPRAWLLDEATGRIAGTPPGPTDQPMAFRVSADDGTDVASQPIQLAVLPSLSPPDPGSLVEAALAGRRRRLAILAGAGRRFPRALAGPPPRDEPPGQPRAALDRRGGPRRRGRHRPALPAQTLRHLPAPRPPHHPLGHHRAGRLDGAVAWTVDLNHSPVGTSDLRPSCTWNAPSATSSRRLLR